jgi:tetratricopeptide (TPR) repeat protein
MRFGSTPLDLIGIKLGTDKSRLRQDYLRQYERLMTGFRDRPITLLEIGIAHGASLRTWEIYFPRASIVGVDIEPATRRFARKHVTIEIGSQFDADFLAELARKYTPDIIIDDGSHISEHQIFSFEHLFHCLKPGGLYVVEDIQHATAELQAADYFTALQRKVLLRQVGPRQAVSPQFKIRDIAHVDIMPGAVGIGKLAKDELDGNFAALEKLAAGAESPKSLFYLAQYIHREAGPLEHALSVARRASAADPKNSWIHLEIARLHVALGDKAEAMKAVREALQLSSTDRARAIFEEYLAQLSADR